MKVWLIILSFVVCLYGYSPRVDMNANFTYKQKEILDEFKDGTITKKAHTTFWSEFKSKLSSQDISNMNTILNHSLYLECWKSAKETLAKARITYTKGLEYEKKKLVEFYEQHNLNKTSLKLMFDDVDNIIYSTLFFIPIKQDDVEISITNEVINNSIKDYEAIKQRLGILLTPEYDLPQKTYKENGYTLNAHVLYNEDKFKIYIKKQYYQIDLLTSDEIDGSMYSIVTFKSKIKEPKFLEDVLSVSFEESFGKKLEKMEKFDTKNIITGYKVSSYREMNDEKLYGTIAVMMTNANKVHIIYIYSHNNNNTNDLLEKYKNNINFE